MNDPIELIFDELRKAEEKHPSWPNDPVDGIAIIVEEVGEAMKEALELKFAKSTTIKCGYRRRLVKETAQVAAVGIRMMIKLCENE